MNKRFLVTLSLVLLMSLSGCGQSDKPTGTDYVIKIRTKFGEMIAVLYDETPKHKANFIKLAREHYYDSLLFHRIIAGFMIQGGDPESKHAAPGQRLGTGGPGYTVEAEINPKFIHEKGAFSAARLADQMNPKKASSGSQFYIVQGRRFSDAEINQGEMRIQYQQKSQYLREILQMPEYENLRVQVMQRQQQGDAAWLNSFFEKSDTLIQQVRGQYERFKYTEEQKARYREVGGAAHLDGDYTVFGKVIRGLEVIDMIASQPKDATDRPLEDIRMTITVEEMPKEKIEELYGYTYNKK